MTVTSVTQSHSHTVTVTVVPHWAQLSVIVCWQYGSGKSEDGNNSNVNKYCEDNKVASKPESGWLASDTVAESKRLPDGVPFFQLYKLVSQNFKNRDIINANIGLSI